LHPKGIGGAAIPPEPQTSASTLEINLFNYENAWKKVKKFECVEKNLLNTRDFWWNLIVKF
jgi:hypothetical protein